jgi:hypothetical protein
MKQFMQDCTLPSPPIQAANIIRLIGDEVTRTGQPTPILPVDFPAIIGAPNREFSARLAVELIERGILSGINTSTKDGSDLLDINLTLDGWELYEAEQRGKIAGKHGFIAMKFGDTILDPFVKDVVKPAVKDGIGYDLLDMRNVARAGIIDKIMQTQIRDAAFVVVDLTHDNSGAYWEAGYAEGLGKPVVYICEAKNLRKQRRTLTPTTALPSFGHPIRRRNLAGNWSPRFAGPSTYSRQIDTPRAETRFKGVRVI